MKKLVVFLAAAFMCMGLMAQNAKIASVNVKDLKGKVVNTNTFNNDGKPFVVCFWATWCHPCLDEMNAINESYADWQKETGIKIYAVSLDDSRTKSRVQPLVNSSEWTYEVMLDENSDFKRAMGVNNPPHTFIIDSDGTILWQHAGYAQGDEQTMINKYKEIIANKK